MADKPQLTWVGSPNFGYPAGTPGRAGNQPIAIVYHVMEGSLAGTDSWFRNPQSAVSAHFGVGVNGEIHQYVDVDDTAWANGIVQAPTWSGLRPGVNPNLYTVSIEHEGRHERDGQGDISAFWVPTEPQYAATLALSRWLVESLQIEVNAEHLIPHSAINSVDRTYCPGPGFPFARLISDLSPASWSPVAEIQRLKDRGLINSDHSAESAVTWGVFATVLNRVLDRIPNPPSP